MISLQRLVDVARRELVQLLVVTEDDDGNVDGAEDGQLVRFLEETAFSLEERSARQQTVSHPSIHPTYRGDATTRIAKRRTGQVECLHRSISVILDRLDLNLPATHPAGLGGALEHQTTER